jgi:hypothetical protein
LKNVIPEVIKLYKSRGGFAEILCKPKILPLKSAVLQQLQIIEQSAEESTQFSTSAQKK